VASDWRRQGIARALAKQFEPRPFRQADCCIQAAVPETDLATQLLLRSAGYKAVRVLREYFVNEDAYLMERCRD
jgi:ribosomal protein S18 acetylase RimI-like enzyme